MREIRRAAERFETRGQGRRTAHSFSFGAHYDPANVGFGILVAHNDDALGPGAGYSDHPHVDTEIVTVVLDGTLAHRSPAGDFADLGEGAVQVQSAGSGIVHSEFALGPTRFVQAWMRPDDSGGRPRREVGTLPPVGGGLAAVAGESSYAALPIGCAGATLWVARLLPGESAELPDAAGLHVFVATGTATAGESRLAAGDSLRARDEGGFAITAAGADGAVTTILTWAFAERIRG